MKFDDYDKNNSKIILDLCGGTGAWSVPYRKAGYTVRVITLPEFDVTRWIGHGNGIAFHPAKIAPMGTKAISVRYEDIYGILAAPPCTEFSYMRNNSKKPRDFEGAMRAVRACMEIIWDVRSKGNLKWWALENPRGYLRQFLGNPAYSFDPTEFGDKHNKRTDLWGFFNPPRKVNGKKKTYSIALTHEERHRIPADYIPDPRMRRDAIARAITPPRFAKAFFKANP